VATVVPVHDIAGKIVEHFWQSRSLWLAFIWWISVKKTS